MISCKIVAWTNVLPPSKWHVEHCCTDLDVASFPGTQKGMANFDGDSMCWWSLLVEKWTVKLDVNTQEEKDLRMRSHLLYIGP